MAELTQERLRELLDYDPETGVFTWRVRRSSNAMPGQRAGTLMQNKYRSVSVDGHRVYEHRLAFLWMNGCLPEDEVDHVNGTTDDNRWENLRQATHSQNMVNISKKSRSLNLYSNLVGACWDRRRSCWRGVITHNGKFQHLGQFESAEDAHAAYLAAKARLHAFQPTPRDA